MNVHTCDACGWETRAPEHVIRVFHPCRPSGGRRRLRRVKLPEIETPEENVRAVWEGFQSALPGEALLRSIEEEE